MPPPMQHAVRGVLVWFVAALWCSVLGQWISALFPRPDRGGADVAGAGGYGSGADRIDMPRDAMVQGA